MLFSRKFTWKEWIKIVLITKQEAHELEQLGYTFDKNEGMLHHSYSKHPKYYLTENKRALKDLEKIRTNKIVK